MSYAERFTQTHRTTFQDQAMLAADHQESLLRPFVSEQTCEGEQHAPALFYDSGKAKRRTGRAPSNRDDPANRRRRWLKFQPKFDSGEYIDSNDKFQGMQDFMSPLMMHHHGNVKRFVDEDVILTGIFGQAFEGELGSTPKEFLPTQVIGATTQDGAGTDATGLNLRKLKNNRKLYAGHKFDLDEHPIVIALTAEQIDDLSDEIELTNADYKMDAAAKFNSEGKLTMVWNHVFVEYQNVPDAQKDFGDGNGLVTYQRVPTWRKPSVRLGVWEEVNSDAWEDTGKYKELYMNVCANMDCRRLEDTGVSEIECLLG